MAYPTLDDDLKIIQKLGTNPGVDDGLTTEEFKAKFDEAPLVIQKFINGLVAYLNAVLGYDDSVSLLKTGGTMTGAIDMNTNRIRNLPEPTKDGDAVPKSYADTKLSKAGGTMTGAIDANGNNIVNLPAPTQNTHPATKEYVDAQHLPVSLSLVASGWVGDTAPYTQTVSVAGILSTDCPHWGAVYSGTLEDKLAQKDAFEVIDDLETADGAVTFTCFEEKPTVDITIQIEVNR